MKVNDKTGVPHRITGLNVDFKRYGTISMNSISSMSRAFLTEYAELFRLETESLVLERSENRKGRWHINFTQEYEGIPVYYSSIGFTVFENGRIPLVGIDYYPDINVEPTPRVSAEEALRIAQEDFTLLSQSDSIITSQLPTLWIFPVENDDSYTHYLAYRLELKYRGFQSMFNESYFVDAHSGEILLRYSNILDASIYGTVSIKYWPEHHYDTQSTGKARREKVRLYNYIGQYLDTDYTSTTGYYNFPNLAVSYYYVRSKLEGSYVKLYQNSENHDAFVYVGAHNWTWNASDATNVYYHANKIHDFFKGSPFNYNDMDYQMDALVNEGSGYNGWADRENIGFGSENQRYWARSSDVVYHEYTHNTIAHLYAVGDDPSFICDGLSGPAYTEARAMDEGLSDYFACTINGNSNFADSVLYSPYAPRNLENNRQRYISQWVLLEWHSNWRRLLGFAPGRWGIVNK